MEKIGLEAVLDDADFIKGMSSYTGALDKADSHTKSIAGSMTGALKGIGSGLLDLGAQAAKLTFAVAVAGATALVGALTYSVKAASEAQAIDKQLDAVLESTGKTAAKAAKEYEDASQTWVTHTQASAEEIGKWKDELTKAEAKLGDMEKAMSKNKNPTQTATLALADMRKEVAGLRAQIGSGSQVITENLAASLGLVAPAARISKEGILDLANSLSLLTPFEDDAIISAESMLLTFTSIGKEVFPQATETVLNMSQALGQDLKSSAIQLGKALNNPIDGISALSRVGVAFTDSQKAMIGAMVEAGDVAGAQKIILAELETEFGNSARAAGTTFSGQLTILKNTLGNVAETIGMALLPQLTGLFSTITTKLASPETQAMIAGLAEAFGKLFGGNVQGAIDSFSGALAHVFGPEKALQIYNFLNGIKDTATGAFTFVRDNVVPILVGAFQTVKGWIDTYGPTIMDVLSKAFNFFADNVLPPLKEGLQRLWINLNDVKLWVQVYGPKLFDEAKEAISGMVTKVGEIWTKVSGFISDALVPLKAWLDENGPLMRSVWGKMVEGMVKDIDQLKQDVPKGFEDTNISVTGIVKEMFRQLGVAVHIGLLELDGQYEEAHKQQQEENRLHGISMQSISDAFMKVHNELIGNRLVELKTDMGIKMGEIRQKMTDKWNEVKGDVQGAWGEIKKFILDPISQAKDGVLQFIEDIKGAFRRMEVHIPSPHFSGGVHWQDFAGISVPVPYVDVNWYKNGLDAIIDKPTLIGVGEAGPERVTVTPQGRMTQNAMTSNVSNTYNYNLSANYRTTQSEGSLRDTVRLLQVG